LAGTAYRWAKPRFPDGTIRAAFTPIAMGLAGDVLVFTPKRLGRDFEKGRYFATIEYGKWIGSARAAFDGIVLAHNELLIRKPELLNQDAFGQAWMLIVRPSVENWRENLITGSAVLEAFEEWLASAAYMDRSE
jgi:glycine cleavage system H protein